MFDTIAGLPVHALVVHAVVVLGPLAALLLIAYVAVPRWRPGLRWPALGLTLIAAASAAVAAASGEELEHRVGQPRFDHAEKGDLAAISLYVLAGVAVVVLLLLLKPGSRGALATLGAVLLVLAAGFVVFAVVNAGHSGASSVWTPIMDHAGSARPGSSG